MSMSFDKLTRVTSQRSDSRVKCITVCHKDQSDKFKCESCSQAFDDVKQLKEHVETMHIQHNDLFKC